MSCSRSPSTVWDNQLEKPQDLCHAISGIPDYPLRRGLILHPSSSWSIVNWKDIRFTYTKFTIRSNLMCILNAVKTLCSVTLSLHINTCDMYIKFWKTNLNNTIYFELEHNYSVFLFNLACPGTSVYFLIKFSRNTVNIRIVVFWFWTPSGLQLVIDFRRQNMSPKLR